jgi:hypothetical protein
MLHDLLKSFPNLISGKGYRRTSPPTFNYNCLAWALNDLTRWWEPDPFNLFYWPVGVKRSYDLKNYIQVCKIHGFTICKNGSLEVGFEKLAIFSDGRDFTHIARQMPDGQWTSKLGEWDDISHSLEGLQGSHYGNPTTYLKRKTSSSGGSANAH